MERHTRKFILRTTCLKNGGFRKYQPLPPQEVFQHVHWVLGSEIDVKVKRKQTLFNRETEWRCLPVYLTTNKGLLFVYMKNDAGYVLRVPSALRICFDGSKKVKKRQQKESFAYSATLIIKFRFGELHLRFDNSDNLHPWRDILMAAVASPNGIPAVGEHAAKEVFGSTSLESVLSTKSVVPDANDKEKADRIVVHRHAINPSGTASESLDAEYPSTTSQSSSLSQQTVSEYSMNAADSVAQSPKAEAEDPDTFINYTSDFDNRREETYQSFDSTKIPACSYEEFQEDAIDYGYMNESYVEDGQTYGSRALSPIPEEVETKIFTKSPEVVPSVSPFASGSETSEVDVSCKDFSQNFDTVSDTSITAAVEPSLDTTCQSETSVAGSTRRLIAQFEQLSPGTPRLSMTSTHRPSMISYRKFEGRASAAATSSKDETDKLFSEFENEFMTKTLNSDTPNISEDTDNFCDEMKPPARPDKAPINLMKHLLMSINEKYP